MIQVTLDILCQLVQSQNKLNVFLYFRNQSGLYIYFYQSI